MKNWKNYQEKTYNNDVCKLLVYFLNNYKISNAIDLGCGSGNETVYMLNHDIRVLAVDRQLNKQYILDRIDENKKENVTFLEHEFENIELPKANAITAFFSIPFCNPKYFNNLWNSIYNSLNNNGYFIGQLFGDRDDWKELLARIKDIRSSEKVLYRQVLDLYATAVDYNPKDEKSIEFFKIVQNKLHYATHGHIASEVIYERADSDKPFMGLTTFKGDIPVLSDVVIAKNMSLKQAYDLYKKVMKFQDGIDKISKGNFTDEDSIKTIITSISFIFNMSKNKKQYEKNAFKGMQFAFW